MIFKINPIGKPRMTQSDKWRKRDCILRYWAFKTALVLMSNKNKFEPTDNLNIVFTVEMAKSWSQKKKAEMDGKPHQNKPDIDNILKAFMDCLYPKDQTVHNVKARKVWGYTGQIEVINQ